MNPSREEALFALALEKPVEKRPAFLDAICDDDAALRQRLDALLAAHEQPETLLATQAEVARPTIKLDLTEAPDETVGQTLGRYNQIQHWSVSDGSVRATIPFTRPAVIDDPNWWEEGKIVCTRNVLIRYSDRRRQLDRLSLTTGEILGDPILGSTRGLAISSDGRLLAFGNGDLELWDISGVPRRRTIISTGHTRLNWAILFSPDDRLVATLNIDSTIKLWDVATGAHVHTLRGHKRGVFGGGFSPDGRTLATASHDRTIKLWNISTGREVASFELPWSPSSVCFSPDGRFLATSSYIAGASVRVWRAPSWEQIEAAEAKEKAETKQQ